MAWWTMGAAVAASVPCPAGGLSAAGLRDTVAWAERAFIEVDPTAFDAAVDRLRLELPCLSELPQPATVGRLHQVLGVQLVLQGDEVRALQALTAARALGATDELLTPLPESHPIRLVAAREAPPRFVPLPEPDGVALWLDGRPDADERPLHRAALLQIVAPDGDVLQTRVLFDDTAVPVYPMAPAAPVAVAPVAGPAAEEVAAPSRTGRRIALVSTAGCAAVTTAALLGAAASTHAAFWDEDVSRSSAELESLQDSANGLSVAAIVTGALTIGASVALVGAW